MTIQHWGSVQFKPKLYKCQGGISIFPEQISNTDRGTNIEKNWYDFDQGFYRAIFASMAEANCLIVVPVTSQRQFATQTPNPETKP